MHDETILDAACALILHDETILDAACALTVPMSTDRIKDFLYDFLKDVDEKATPLYRINSQGLFDHYQKYCNKNSLDVGTSKSDHMSFGSRLGRWKSRNNIDGCSQANKKKQGHGIKGTESTWTFDVAKVKSALDPNVSSKSVTSTMTSSRASVSMDDDESEPKCKKTKTEPSVRLKNLEECKQYITSDEYDRKKAEILATI